MLKTLDILIGLSLVMILLSMVVTMVTQALINLTRARGLHLLTGVTELLEQIHPDLSKEVSGEIAKKMLQHPLIRSGKFGLGTVIQREELTKLLLAFGSDADKGQLTETARNALKKALEDHGVTDPAGTLKQVRQAALELEKAKPELANSARQSLALIEKGPSELVGKIHGWFDQTMDRVSDRFTYNTRILTLVSALLVAGAFQLDTLALINRLSTDDALREALVAQAKATAEKDANAVQTTQLRDFMTANGVLPVPSFQSWEKWKQDIQDINLMGFCLSVALLSLGGPFWFNALKQILQLRSVAAGKEDKVRLERQTTQKPETPQQQAGAAAAG